MIAILRKWSFIYSYSFRSMFGFSNFRIEQESSRYASRT